MKSLAKLPGVVSLVLCLSALVLGCSDSRDDGGGGQLVTEAAQIEVLPLQVVFSSAIIGAGELAPVEQIIITNNGAGDLQVKSIRLEEDDPVKEFELAYEVPVDGEGVKRFQIDEKEVCPNMDNFTLVGVGKEDDTHRSYCVMWVVYRPSDTERDSGRILLRSNDTGQEEVTVTLSTGESKPQLTVQPPEVRFGDVTEGATATQELTLFNSGKANLEIQRIELANDADGQFTVEIAQDKGTYNSYPATLRPGVDVVDRETMVLLVHYTPNRIGGADGKLRIESNDPNNQVYEVDISASSIKPCIEILPADADFGDVAIGESKELALDLTNCGNAPLVITEASLVDPGEGTSEDFHIHSAPGGLDCAGGDTTCTGEITIGEASTETLVLQYTPGEEGPDGGRLYLNTNVPGKEDLEVLLFGRGTTNTCPVAVGQARIAGSDTWDLFPDTEHQLVTIPLKTLELRGDNSDDPDGAIDSYQWTVVERPDDSTAQLSPHEAHPNPTFFLDLAGTYVFELQVVDNKGLPSCQNARVVVDAVPDEDIHVQLVWDTPADPDQTDEGFAAGSDMDVHVLHPLGEWFDMPHDCFYGNPNPDWGRPANPSDDPSLDRDDTDGAGPENINLDNPENNRVYRVGVHYFNDHGYGASFVTVRVFVQGSLRFELANKRMPSTDYFWDVATIAWPGGHIQQIDNLLAAAPNGG